MPPDPSPNKLRILVCSQPTNTSVRPVTLTLINLLVWIIISLAPFSWSYFVPPSSSYIRTPHAQATQVWKTEWGRTDDMDHKKDRCEQPHMNDLVVIFIIFNHLTKLLFCLLLSSNCSLTIVSEDNSFESLFPIKFRPANSVRFYLFLFCTVGGDCDRMNDLVIRSWGTGRTMIFTSTRP